MEESRKSARCLNYRCQRKSNLSSARTMILISFLVFTLALAMVESRNIYDKTIKLGAKAMSMNLPPIARRRIMSILRQLQMKRLTRECGPVMKAKCSNMFGKCHVTVLSKRSLPDDKFSSDILKREKRSPRRHTTYRRRRVTRIHLSCGLCQANCW
ncbi:unnamed protein product [Clavelina lepadiformis]|uniref:Uncharacterized protein n=1 Tax=Clavelina lepadiformis TaxID=159417 RepID=A0ABP0GX00_CLALP